MESTNYNTIKDHSSRVYSDREITRLLQGGWVLITTRTIRPEPDSDGSFTEETIYVLGTYSEDP